MKNKKNNEELQSRRQFFKQAAKGALPIIAAAVLASAPAIVKAAEPPMDCSYGCTVGCYTSCRTTCSGGCLGDCLSSCKDYCTGTCRDTCQSGCKNSCYYTSIGSY